MRQTLSHIVIAVCSSRTQRCAMRVGPPVTAFMPDQGALMPGIVCRYRKRHRHIDVEVLKRWAWQILCGLVYLHGHSPPIIHRVRQLPPPLRFDVSWSGGGLLRQS